MQNHNPPPAPLQSTCTPAHGREAAAENRRLSPGVTITQRFLLLMAQPLSESVIFISFISRIFARHKQGLSVVSIQRSIHVSSGYPYSTFSYTSSQIFSYSTPELSLV